jgi:large subunit ribosomal protein L15
MPLQKRLPKYGFTSRVSRVSAEVRLVELNQIEGDVVDLAALRQAGLIGSSIERAKIFLAGELDAGKVLVVRGLSTTRGARAAIEAAGGSVEALV